MKRIVLAIVAAAFLVLTGTAIVYAQWPTTCVDLNDIVEAHLGNHDNVGIYQRVYGHQAEEHCQNDHRADVQATFAWAFRLASYTPSSGTPSGGWPETCVQLNDIVEAHLGNHGNVGIYQRAYGYSETTAWRSSWTYQESPIQGWRWTLTGPASRSGVEPSNGGKLDLIFDDLPPGSYTFTVRVFTAAGDGTPAVASFTVEGLPSPEAESNCRNDHRNDVQATFAWAFSGSAPPTAPPPSTPTPQAGGSPPTAPRAIHLLEVGAYVVKIDIQPPLDGGGLPMQGYRWTLTGPGIDYADTILSGGDSAKKEFYNLPEGDYTFTARAFNARGDGLSTSVTFTIKPPRDPLFQEAIALLWSHVVPVQPNLANILDITRDVPIVFGAVRHWQGGNYRFSTRTVTIRPDYRNRPLEALAIILAHELVHAAQHIEGRIGPTSSTEQCFQSEVQAYRWQAAVTVALGWQSEAVDHWRSGTLDWWVRSDPNYQEQCAA